MDKLREKFEQYFMGIEIPDNMAQNDENKIVAELYSYCQKITPSNLFRYRSCNDNHIKAFKNDQLFLSKPTKFNDPHDSLLYIDKKNILNEILKINAEKSFDHVSRLISDEKFKIDEIKRLGENFVEKIITNSTIDGKPVKISEAYLEFLNKHHEHRLDLIIDLAKKSMKQASLVACLSETNDSTLMWAHYSSNHTGFALNYDMKALYSVDIGMGKTKGSLFVDNKLFPIIYTKKRYDASYYVEFHFIDDFYRHLGLEFHYPFYDKLFYYKSLLFKSKDWEYEREWRLIRQTDNNIENDKPDFAFIGNIKPKEIYLGSDISSTNKLELIDIAKKKEIPIYQMEVDDGEVKYKLRHRKIK